MATGGRSFDLGLLRTFLAIYETRQVSAAAERLHLTQPTISYQLGRLRDSIGDALFTRTSTGMVPTEVGEALYERFTAAVQQVDVAVEAVQLFDPATSIRRFKIAMSEAGEAVFLSRVMSRVQHAAPHVTLEVVHRSVEELPALLAVGQIDAIVGGDINLPKAEVRSSVLYSDVYACVIRHDMGGDRAKISLKAYAAASHIDVVSTFSWHSKLDAAIRMKGVTRQIGVQVPHYISIPDLVAECGHVATLPRSFAALLIARHPELAVVPLPVTLPRFNICVYWHDRHKSNEALRWLREMMTASLRESND